MDYLKGCFHKFVKPPAFVNTAQTSSCSLPLKSMASQGGLVLYSAYVSHYPETEVSTCTQPLKPSHTLLWWREACTTGRTMPCSPRTPTASWEALVSVAFDWLILRNMPPKYLTFIPDSLIRCSGYQLVLPLVVREGTACCLLYYIVELDTFPIMEK